MKKIVIPSGVKVIEEGAFQLCTSLKSASIAGSVKTIDRIAFSLCNNLKNVSISSGVQSIGESAFFFCQELKRIVIPKSVISIGDFAFGYAMPDELVKISGFTIYGTPESAASFYAGVNGFSFKETLSTTKLTSVKWNKKKKKVIINWKANKAGSGYQIQFSTTKDFSVISKKYTVKPSSTSNATVSKIPKGTYYVRICTVKGKDSSDWSAVKSVKVV